MSSADLWELRLTAILGAGRSGSTLLRNELLKPDEVSCLSSEGAYAWYEANRALLCHPDANEIVRRHATLERQWTELGFPREDLKRQFARHPGDSTLQRILLVKFPLVRFGGRSRGLFRHVHVVHLARDPLAVVESMCRPLPWNEDQPFWAGKRAHLIAERGADLCAFARSEGTRAIPCAPEALTAMPYHLACASWVAGYARVHGEIRAREEFCRSSISLRFEDFVRDRDALVCRIGAFMGVQTLSYPPNDDYYQDVEGEGGIRMSQRTGANGRGHSVTALGPLERRQVLDVVGRVREDLGYGARSSPQARRALEAV